MKGKKCETLTSVVKLWQPQRPPAAETDKTEGVTTIQKKSWAPAQGLATMPTPSQL